jgi:hypothetical protein
MPTRSLRIDARSQAPRGVLQHEINLLARDAREPLDKLFNGGSAFEVGEESGDRDPCSLEDPRSAELQRIPFDSGASGPVEH